MLNKVYELNVVTYIWFLRLKKYKFKYVFVLDKYVFLCLISEKNFF